jgi:hypothetical protein
MLTMKNPKTSKPRATDEEGPSIELRAIGREAADLSLAALRLARRAAELAVRSAPREKAA